MKDVGGNSFPYSPKSQNTYSYIEDYEYETPLLSEIKRKVSILDTKYQAPAELQVELLLVILI